MYEDRAQNYDPEIHEKYLVHFASLHFRQKRHAEITLPLAT